MVGFFGPVVPAAREALIFIFTLPDLLDADYVRFQFFLSEIERFSALDNCENRLKI